MMAPPSLAHQRIAWNLCELLNRAFVADRRDLFAYHEIAIRLPGVTNFILANRDDPIDMPELGLRCSVGDLYRGTPLDPRRE